VTAGWIYIKRASAGDGCRIRRQLRCDRAKEAVANTMMIHTSSTMFARKDILMIPRKGHEI
jgi:aspartate carbamoyltransferase regulatory subunit